MITTILCPACDSIIPARVTPYGDLSDPGGGFLHIQVQCNQPGCYWRGETSVDIPGPMAEAMASRRTQPARPTLLGRRLDGSGGLRAEGL
jgi:hypothetical protein